MRLTRTNSGADSKGVVRFGRWEIEGEAYLYVVVGGVLAVLVFAMAASLPLLGRIAVASIPVMLSVAWVKCFFVGRPPHYLADFAEKLIAGRHFNLRPQSWSRLPPPRDTDSSSSEE
jgi:hypothetical protein